MRFLIICFLFSLALSGQGEQKLSAKYVWAESGLVLRKEGRKDAVKLSVIPYGTKVKLTGKWGDRIDLEVFPSLSYSWGGEELVSEPYIMTGNYVEVKYDGQQGFVFSGYLSYYPTDGPAEAKPDWNAWLNKVGGKIDTLLYNCMLPECGRSESRFLYENGITQTDRETEGGGTSVFTFPIGDINDGFLLGCRFFGFSYAIEHLEKILQQGDYPPTLLSKAEDGSIGTSDDMCYVHVQYIGGMLVISTGCSC
jgi:hypothetical protein